MNHFRRQILRASLCGLAASTAQAGPAPLRMVVLDLMPWAGYDAAGRLHGAAVDMAVALGAEIGRPVLVLAVPYARAIAMLNGGNAELMLAIDATEKKELPAPLCAIGAEEVIVLSRHGTRYKALHELCGRQVAMLRRASFDTALHDYPGIIRYETNSYEQGLRMLRQGRLDAVAGARSTMEYALRRLGLTPSEFSAPLLAGTADISLYVAPRADQDGLSARLLRACAVLRRQKKMPALLAQYRLLG